jgi:hypothetical protein
MANVDCIVRLFANWHQLACHSDLELTVGTDLIVNIFVQILDEDVALPSLTERRVALRPHDAATIKTRPTSAQKEQSRALAIGKGEGEENAHQARFLIRE